ncbi:hypothetical protein ALC56_12778 [Trachymyrmex septentrionalis]|uniref:Uncharacterized protein n=1 Tax=Trachymyrmex septentrionalis TaxID=34720 RepID=A0A195EYH8_9HYME|nr:hypothetical protein ALC56_12778 [Trachymyrmex septentrionalis]
MVGLLLAAETCGRNVLSGNGNGNGKEEEAKRREGLKGVSADEEDIYRLTCYTCVNVSDNQVSKSCANSEECGPASVGCIPMDTQQVRNSEFCHVPGGQRNENAKKKKKQYRNTREKYRRNEPPGEINSVISFQICISCCDLSYCNIESPTNATNAIYSRQRRAKSKSKRKRPGRNGVDAATRLYGSSLLWLPASLFYAYHC